MKDFIKLVEESRLTLPIIVLLGFMLRIIFQVNNLIAIDFLYIFFGIFTIFTGYLMSLNLLHSRLIAVLTALFITISPSMIEGSINSVEASIATSFILLSITLLSIRQYPLFLAMFYFASLFEKGLLLTLPLIYFLFLRLEEKFKFEFIKKKFLFFLGPYTIITFLRFYFDSDFPSPLFVDYINNHSYTFITNHLPLFKAGTLLIWSLLSFISYYSMNNFLRIRSIPIWMILIFSTWHLLLEGQDYFVRYLLETFLIILSAFAIGYKYRSISSSQQLHHQA